MLPKKNSVEAISSDSEWPIGGHFECRNLIGKLMKSKIVSFLFRIYLHNELQSYCGSRDLSLLKIMNCKLVEHHEIY